MLLHSITWTDSDKREICISWGFHGNSIQTTAQGGEGKRKNRIDIPTAFYKWKNWNGKIEQQRQAWREVPIVDEMSWKSKADHMQRVYEESTLPIWHASSTTRITSKCRDGKTLYHLANGKINGSGILIVPCSRCRYVSAASRNRMRDNIQRNSKCVRKETWQCRSVLRPAMFNDTQIMEGFWRTSLCRVWRFFLKTENRYHGYRLLQLERFHSGSNAVYQ